MPKDYYSILGVTRSASADELKRAYRKLALQFHPDKPTGNEEKFKEINEAYQVLGDQEKRAHYDRFGTAEGAGGTGQEAWGTAFDPFEIFQREFSGFEDLFGDLFGGGGQRRGRNATDQGDDRATAITITFEEMVRGGKRELTLERLRTCPKCAGSGAEPGTTIRTCATCKGAGVTERHVRTFLGAMLHRTICPDCQGMGKRPDKPCRACSGAGRTHQRDTLVVKLPPGLEDGMRLRVSGEGETGVRGGPAGDLFVTVHIKSHPTLARDGHHLRSMVMIPFSVLALGGTWTVETIDGPAEVPIARGTASGTELRIPKKGVVLGRHGDSDRRGDHIVTVVVDVPKRLTRDQEELLRKFAGR